MEIGSDLPIDQSLCNLIKCNLPDQSTLNCLVILQKIIQNIIQNPEDEKYRILKKSN